MDLQELVDRAAAGSEVKIPAGTHTAHLWIERSITLVGSDDAEQHVIDGQGKGPVITVAKDDASVRLVGLTFTGGDAEAGGAVALLGGELDVVRCELHDNGAPMYGGGGLYVTRGRATLVDCVITRNKGRQGGGVLADQGARVSLRGCLINGNAAFTGGGLTVLGAAEVTCVHCTLADNRALGDHADGDAVFVSGTTTSKPTLSIRNSIIQSAGTTRAVANHDVCPGTIEIHHSLIPPGVTTGTFLDGGQTVADTPGFARDSLALGPDSAALGLGDPSAVEPDARDLAGTPRLRSGRVDAGALAFVP